MSVIIFTQRDDTAQRTVSAFQDEYKIRGGQVIAEHLVEGEAIDLPAKITALLAGNGGNASAIYIALKAPQARALMAQLKTSSLATTQKLAASLILNGASASQDVVLDGIEIPELPWLLNQYGGLANAESVAKTMPSIRGPAQRLFAFGADAWQLQRLSGSPAKRCRIHARGSHRQSACGTAWAMCNVTPPGPSLAADDHAPLHVNP